MFRRLVTLLDLESGGCLRKKVALLAPSFAESLRLSDWLRFDLRLCLTGGQRGKASNNLKRRPAESQRLSAREDGRAVTPIHLSYINLARTPQALCFHLLRRSAESLCILLIALPASAQQTGAVSQNGSSSTTVSASISRTEDRYRIGPGDVLDIRILNRPNLSREAVRVEGSGMIRMPLIETEIRAACQTEGELADEIRNRYLKFYRNPQVDVFIKEYHSRQVAIIGAVNDQSRFELQRRVRLLELLSYAKGPTTKAGQIINIVHSPPALLCEKPGDETTDIATAFSTYRLADTLQGDPKANPFLEAGDIVTIPEADQVYVVGNVFTPITIPLKEPITLSRAIAMAGGTKQDTKKEKVRIIRQEPGSATRQELVVDLSAIERKRAEDVALMPNDIIDVPQSGAKSFIRSLLGSVAPSVSQLPVRVIP